MASLSCRGADKALTRFELASMASSLFARLARYFRSNLYFSTTIGELLISFRLTNLDALGVDGMTLLVEALDRVSGRFDCNNVVRSTREESESESSSSELLTILPLDGLLDTALERASCFAGDSRLEGESQPGAGGKCEVYSCCLEGW